MKKTLISRLALVATMVLFSQFASAQNEANIEALRTISGIVSGLNHFPSDEDLAKLDAIIGNSELAQPVRTIADTVANIEHSANEEGRGAMEAIEGNAQMPEPLKALAGIVGSINHTASDAQKAQLAGLFSGG